MCLLSPPSLAACCCNGSRRSRRGTNAQVALGRHILLVVVGLPAVLVATSKQFAQTPDQRTIAIASTQPLASQYVILNPCPDTPGSQIALDVAREQRDVLIDGVGIGRVVEDAGRAADVEDGPPVPARGHVVGEQAGQGEDRVEGRAQCGRVVLQYAPGGGGIVVTKVGVAYHEIDLHFMLFDNGFVQLFGGRRSRRQVGRMRRHVDLILMLISQLGGEFVEWLLPSADEDEVVPQGGMVVREGQTRSGGRADDEDDLPSIDAIVGGMAR